MNFLNALAYRVYPIFYWFTVRDYPHWFIDLFTPFIRYYPYFFGVPEPIPIEMIEDVQEEIGKIGY
jgi:hypothetical protein